MLALEVALLSEPGGRRYNEDACGHWHSTGALCCVLADGAGGHGGGGTASRLVVEHLLQAFAAQPELDGAQWEHLVREANQALLAARVPGTDSANMHATVVGLVIDFIGHRASWAHAGDSRLYWFRNRRIQLQTHDHSLVQSLVDGGLLPADQARSHPQRSELRSALGLDDAQLEVTHSGALQDVAAGDVFLLCSDGLWEYVTEPQMEATLQAAATPQDWLSALELAIANASGRRANHDNFTAMAVWTATAPT